MAEHDEAILEVIDRIIDRFGDDPEFWAGVDEQAARIRARFRETAPLVDLIPWKREAGDG